MSLVGIVANPASGRDIRRLVAGASVFGNSDKAGMVLRALIGLGACGVERVLMMPAADGLGSSLSAMLRSHAHDGAAPLPELQILPVSLTSTARDTARSVALMREAGVRALIVLGGDGTHRVVAKHCAQIPICALSTGTNNAFPEMREATIAGLATGLAVTGRGGPDAVRRAPILTVTREGAEAELALIDAALTADRFTGARALWRAESLRELVSSRCTPSSVGLSAIAGLLAPAEHGSGRGLHVRFANPGAAAEATFDVALAPGLIATVRVAGWQVLEPGGSVALDSAGGALALDGEREVELRPGEEVVVALTPGPPCIDVDAVMRHAAAERATWLQPAATYGSHPH